MYFRKKGFLDSTFLVGVKIQDYVICMFMVIWCPELRVTYLIEVLYKYKLIFKTLVAVGKHYHSHFYSQ